MVKDGELNKDPYQVFGEERPAMPRWPPSVFSSICTRRLRPSMAALITIPFPMRMVRRMPSPRTVCVRTTPRISTTTRASLSGCSTCFIALIKPVVRLVPSSVFVPLKVHFASCSHENLGVYIWGVPGSGKSIMTDILFDCIDDDIPKEKMSFDVFIKGIKDAIHQYQQIHGTEKDAVNAIASEVGSNTKILFLDDFSVWNWTVQWCVDWRWRNCFNHAKTVLAVILQGCVYCDYFSSVWVCPVGLCIELLMTCIRMVPIVINSFLSLSYWNMYLLMIPEGFSSNVLASISIVTRIIALVARRTPKRSTPLLPWRTIRRLVYFFRSRLWIRQFVDLFEQRRQDPVASECAQVRSRKEAGGPLQWQVYDLYFLLVIR